MILAIDIGGTSTKAAYASPDGHLREPQSIPTGPTAPIYLDALAEMVDKMLKQGSSKPDGLGVAVAGFLDPERSRLIYNSNLAWLERFPLRDWFSEHFGLPVELEVDSNAACLAEYRFGAGAGAARFLCLVAGTGLGVGMTVNDGHLLRFAHGCMGDAGHIIVEPAGQDACTCGGYGCAEAVAGAAAIATRYAERRGDKNSDRSLSLRDVIERSRSADVDATEVLSRAGHALGILLASLASLFFPDRISLAGGLSTAGDAVFRPMKEAFDRNAGSFAKQNVTIVPSQLGPNATLMGAAAPFWTSLPGQKFE